MEYIKLRICQKMSAGPLAEYYGGVGTLPVRKELIGALSTFKPHNGEQVTRIQHAYSNQVLYYCFDTPEEIAEKLLMPYYDSCSGINGVENKINAIITEMQNLETQYAHTDYRLLYLEAYRGIASAKTFVNLLVEKINEGRENEKTN